MSSGNRKRVECFTPMSTPYGISYGQWTVKWWQWLLSIGRQVNPALDSTGKFARMNQTDSAVWFLAGTLGGETVKRSCEIPSGRSILFPLLNYEMNPLENSE